METLYPDRDPVAIHQKFWQTSLIYPGGGKYVWNKDFQTMESTASGHPRQPKTGPTLLLRVLKAWKETWAFNVC